MAGRAKLECITTGECTKRDVEVVLAQYDEDIRWSDLYRAVRTVYCKGDESMYLLTPDCTRLPNVGRESHTYLHHVVERYDSLAGWTVFSQAGAPTLGYGFHKHGPEHPGGHMFRGVSFHDYVLGEGPFNDSDDARFLFDAAIKVDNGTLWYKVNSDYANALGSKQSGVRMRRPCQIHGTVETRPEHNFSVIQNYLAHKCFHGNATRVPLALQSYVRNELGGHLGSRTVFFSQGARFAVSRARIRQRPRAFYQRLLDLVSESKSPCQGFFNEWLWYYIMGAPDHVPC
jgi:hypothetical protein